MYEMIKSLSIATEISRHIIVRQSLVLCWFLVQDLLQFVLERGLRVLFYYFVDVTEQVVEAVAFLDGDYQVVHHLPVILHLLLQVALQSSHEVLTRIQLVLHHI